MIYPEGDFLQLSGLQHFKFCRRQWALIYIENQWAENFRTTDGAILHENAHNGGFTESRGDLLVTRDMRIFSRTLGVSGACDVLEFRRGKTGTPRGVRGLKYPVRCLPCNGGNVAPRVVEKSRKNNEKSNDKVPDKVPFSMREPVEETRDLIALYAESSQAQHMCLALLENIISVLQSTCKNRA